MRFTKAALVIAAFASGAAMAAPGVLDWKWSDVYVGAAMGQSDFKSACSGVSFCDHTDTGWKVFGGYQLNSWLAAEIAYQDLGEASLRDRSLKGKVGELVGVASYPFGGGFSVYGKLGVYDGKLKTQETSKTKAGATYGAGMRYDFTANWAVRAEWQRYDGLGGDNVVKTDVDVLGVGVLYRFR